MISKSNKNFINWYQILVKLKINRRPNETSKYGNFTSMHSFNTLGVLNM